MSRCKGLGLRKGEKGMWRVGLGKRKEQWGERMDLIYMSGIWERGGRDFGMIKR